MQWAQKPIVRRYVVSNSTTKPPNISSLGHRIVENWPRTFCKKKGSNFSLWMLKIEVTLWEDISNMRWDQKLLMWRFLLCNSTIDWKNNRYSRARILENRCFTDGGIIRSRISPLFSVASFLKISITCSEPRSRQYGIALYPTVTTKPPNISSLGHRIVENWPRTFCKKIV